MGDNEKIRRYKVIETQWELTEGFGLSKRWNMKRKQKKENKKLNKEQQKLTEKVSGLQENLETLKTQTAEILPPKPTLKDMMKNIFKRKEKETL